MFRLTWWLLFFYTRRAPIGESCKCFCFIGKPLTQCTSKIMIVTTILNRVWSFHQSIKVTCSVNISFREIFHLQLRQQSTQNYWRLAYKVGVKYFCMVLRFQAGGNNFRRWTQVQLPGRLVGLRGEKLIKQIHIQDKPLTLSETQTNYIFGIHAKIWMPLSTGKQQHATTAHLNIFPQKGNNRHRKHMQTYS